MSRAVAGVSIALGVLLACVPAASAALMLTVSTVLPSELAVGQTSVAASLTITNTSSPPENADITVDAITLTPSCGNASGQTCSSPDQVFSLSSTGLGRALSGCDRQVFSISETGAEPGTWRLVKVGEPPHVSSWSPCEIDFTVNVQHMPKFDAAPELAGVQTSHVTFASASTPNFATGSATSSGQTTIHQAETSLATTAGSSTIGQSVTASASLAGGMAPTGSISFRAYGPGDAACSRAAVFISNVAVASGRRSYTSAPFTPTEAGSYRWIAEYGGDTDDLSAATECVDGVNSVMAPRPKPTATTSTAVMVTARGARVRGGVSPVGSPTTYVFQYGLTSSYGARTPATSAGNAGSIAASAFLSALRVATTYHFRIVATNEVGSSVGRDQTFRTLRAAPTGVSLAGSPARDPTVPYRFVAAGRVVRPADVSASRGCLGSLLVTVRRSGTFLLSRLVPLSTTCTYAAPLPLPNLRGSGTLAVSARFLGNVALLPRTAPARTVQFG